MKPNRVQTFLAKTILGVSMKAARMPFIAGIASRYGGGVFGARRTFIDEYQNWVYACVNARSEEVGNMQLKLFKGDKLVTDHEILDLLNKVNPYMTSYELFEATQAYKDLDGNAFWYLARDNEGKGKILEIYILRPDKVQIVPDKTNGLVVAGYVYTGPDGKKVPFAPNEILHHKTFNPRNYYPYPGRGMGVVEAAITAIDTDNKAREWNLNFFENGAKPDGVLTVPGDSTLDPDEYKRLQEEWNSEHQGSTLAHKVSILSGGLKWQETTRSQTDMDFVNQRTFSRDEILALFRTPKSIIGISDDVNRANAEATIFVFSLRTVKPLMQRLVNTLNEFLVPEFGDDLRLDFVSPVSEDRVTKIAEYTAGLNNWLSRNEIRALEGLSPTENGDEFFGPSMNVEQDKTKPEPTKAVHEPTSKEKKPTKAQVKSAAEKAVEKLIIRRTVQGKMPNAQKHYTVKALTKEATTKYLEEWKTHVNTTLPLEKALDEYFTTQESEVKANVRRELKKLTKKQMKYKGVSDIVFDTENAISTGISLITPFIKDYILTSGNNATALVGGTAFDATTDALDKFVANRAKFFATTINDTTSEDLVRSIKEGLDAGESIEDIQGRVQDIYQVAKDSRTDMIARTEVAAASNAGATNAYIQAGITSQQWAVVSPQDEDCAENDGDIEKIGDEFPSGDEAPPVHPNCQCTLLPVFDDASDDSGDE